MNAVSTKLADIERLNKILAEASLLRQSLIQDLQYLSRPPNSATLLPPSVRDPFLRASDRALTQPRTLPRDVLQEIFIQCLSPSRGCRMNVMEAPMLLCRVCSSWRQVALGTTQLWSSLRLDIDLYTSQRQRLQLENASGWISRSGTQPLVIDINCTTSESDWGYVKNPFASGDSQPALPHQATVWPFVTQFVAELLRHSSRWREISIYGPFYWITPLLTLSPARVPILQRFSHRASDRHPGTEIWKSMNFLAAQSLRELSLVFDGHSCSFLNTRPEMNLDQAITLFPLTQLTVLHLEGWGCDILQVSQLLARCTNVEICTVQTYRLDFRLLPASIVPFSLPRLSSFSLCEVFTEISSAKSFFASMDAPRLTHLHYFCQTEFLAPWIAPDSPFCFIQNLALHICDSSQPDIGEFLCDNIFLRRLRFNRSPDHRGHDAFPFLEKYLLEQLMPDSEEGLLCPRLETLELLDCHSPPEELEFFKLLSARSLFQGDDGIIHFKRARFSFKAAVDLEVFNCLDPLIESGLVVAVEYERLRYLGQGRDERLVFPESAEFEWP
ncbi:hypothetical protein C8J56DRAFT_71292 [Mycena floridula]|nr:hypothetical protein C8J56DRAFT_71292 [Mycena floridula]